MMGDFVSYQHILIKWFTIIEIKIMRLKEAGQKNFSFG